MSNDDNGTESGVSEEHKDSLIDDDLPTDPEQVKDEVKDFPTE